MANIQVIGDDMNQDGTEENDVITLLFGDRDTMNGLGGDDLINASSGGPAVLNGNEGRDFLRGNDGDTFDGGTGSDTIDLNLQSRSDNLTVDLEAISGHIGVHIADALAKDIEKGFISFGSGNDVATASSTASLLLYGFDGDDALTGRGLADTLGGGQGNDTLSGAAGNDVIYGYAPDTFNPSQITPGGPDDGLGVKVLRGGDGDDLIVSALGLDNIFGDAGVDTVSYASVTEGGPSVSVNLKHIIQHTGGAGDDRLRGIENVIGGGGSDTITGDNAANQLNGALGDDLLFGGLGADTLTGGEGNDRFRYMALTDLNGDRVVDLDSNDLLDLRAIDADTTRGGNQHFKVVDAFSGVAGQLTVHYDSHDNVTTAQVDVNGDTIADATWLLNGNHEANQDNFML